MIKFPSDVIFLFNQIQTVRMEEFSVKCNIVHCKPLQCVPCTGTTAPYCQTLLFMGGGRLRVLGHWYIYYNGKNWGAIAPPVPPPLCRHVGQASIGHLYHTRSLLNKHFLVILGTVFKKLLSL